MDGKIFRQIYHDLFGFTSLTSVFTATKKKLFARADSDTPRPRRLIPLSQAVPHLAFEERRTRSGAGAGILREA